MAGLIQERIDEIQDKITAIRRRDRKPKSVQERIQDRKELQALREEREILYASRRIAWKKNK